MTHRCHWPGCPVEVPPAQWGCKAHWFSLPKRLRDSIWQTYRRGQEVTKQPSPEYIAAAQEVQRWIGEFRASGCGTGRGKTQHGSNAMTLSPSTEQRDDGLAEFTAYFVKNYPGPNTIIGNPNWHAPKIFRAAQYAIRQAAIPREVPPRAPTADERSYFTQWLALGSPGMPRRGPAAWIIRWPNGERIVSISTVVYGETYLREAGCTMTPLYSADAWLAEASLPRPTDEK